MTGSERLIDELSDKRNQKWIKKNISATIKDSGVLKDKGKIEFYPFFPGDERCTLIFKVDSSSSMYDEDLTIIIRPDNGTDDRVLRVVLQEGSKIIQKAENKDRKRYSSGKVFHKEIVAIEGDIKEYLYDYVKRMNAS